MFELELDKRYSGPNILSRLGNVFHPLADEYPDANEVRKAVELIETIAIAALNDMNSTDGFWNDPQKSKRGRTTYTSFQQALRADGLDLVEGRVAPFLSPAVDPAKEEGLLESRLKNYGFDVALNHLEQATDNAAREQWEAANGQIRSFLEALCNSIASRIYQGNESPPTQGQARKYLADSGFLNSKESDLLKALFQVLHGEGGHAGKSSSDDCRRRLLMAEAMSNYYLERLNGWKKVG